MLTQSCRIDQIHNKESRHEKRSKNVFLLYLRRSVLVIKVPLSVNIIKLKHSKIKERFHNFQPNHQIKIISQGLEFKLIKTHKWCLQRVQLICLATILTMNSLQLMKERYPKTPERNNDQHLNWKQGKYINWIIKKVIETQIWALNP